MDTASTDTQTQPWGSLDAALVSAGRTDADGQGPATLWTLHWSVLDIQTGPCISPDTAVVSYGHTDPDEQMDTTGHTDTAPDSSTE